MLPQHRFLLGREFIPTGPDEACNCNFGGDDAKTLCITSGHYLWTVPLNTAGWQSGAKAP